MNEELYEVLEALCDMWSQYCPLPYGHMCMSAGEHAEEVLNKYVLLKNDKGYGGEVDYKRLETLKSLINDK